MFIFLVLMDVIALSIFLFHEHLPILYLVSSVFLPMMKGGFYFITSGDILSAIDIIVAITMIGVYIGFLGGTIWWIIVLYFLFKIGMSMTAFT